MNDPGEEAAKQQPGKVPEAEAAPAQCAEAPPAAEGAPGALAADNGGPGGAPADQGRSNASPIASPAATPAASEELAAAAAAPLPADAVWTGHREIRRTAGKGGGAKKGHYFLRFHLVSASGTELLAATGEDQGAPAALATQQHVETA